MLILLISCCVRRIYQKILIFQHQYKYYLFGEDHLHLAPINSNLQNKNQRTNQPSFSNGGAILAALAKPLQSFDANPIGGVIFLDITSAIAPNTVIDTVKRNPDQGFETFRRESSGLIINCILPGILVPAVAYLAKKGVLGDAFSNIEAHKIWANKDNIDEATAAWKKIGDINSEEERARKIFKEFTRKMQPDSQSKLKLDPNSTKDQIKAAEDKFAIAYKNTKKGVGIDNKTLIEIHNDLATAYGKSKSITIKGESKTYTTPLKNYIRDHFALSKAFSDKAVTPHNIDVFSDNLKKLLKFKSIATMIGVGALALSMQAINRSITEKMTGRKGYSGYKDLSIDAQPTEEEKRKLLKGKFLSAAWFTGLAFLSMGKLSPEILNFAAPTTTMNQARTLSLLTDFGRVSAADEKNELKDTTLRDTVIFMNLYVLGDYIQKGFVELAQKMYKKTHGDLNLMNEPEKLDKNASLLKKIGHWVKGKSVKSFEEIEGTATNLLKDAKTTQLRKNIVTAANLTGIGYSLFALGIIIPILIAKMTNNNRKKQIAKVKSSAETPVQQQSKT
jgi:hypothetical protein